MPRNYFRFDSARGNYFRFDSFSEKIFSVLTQSTEEIISALIRPTEYINVIQHTKQKLDRRTKNNQQNHV